MKTTSRIAALLLWVASPVLAQELQDIALPAPKMEGGLPLMLRFSAVGFKVLGFDIDPAKVAALNEGRSYIEHIKSESLIIAR